MNKKVSIGICLIAVGLFATIILFNIRSSLMGIGNVMTFVGVIFLGHGIDEKKKRNIGSNDENKPCSSLDEAVESLRKKIISEIIRKPNDEYQLSNLLWTDAVSCFPEYREWGLRCAEFKLDLETGKLKVRLSRYPNDFGPTYDAYISLSPTKFNQIAKRYNMSQELQMFCTEEDWAKIFDDKLKIAVSSNRSTLQKQREECEKIARKECAVEIPETYAILSPYIGFSEIIIEIRDQSYSHNISVTNEDGKYQINYVDFSYPESANSCEHKRVLSDAEALWLEEMVKETICNPDESARESNTMNVEIKRYEENNISLKNVKEIKKYSNLHQNLKNLAIYGSRFIPKRRYER